MKFYQIKSEEKGAKPPIWYRLLVPSGITFSQLYILLAYLHGEIYDLSSIFYYETKDRSVQIEEFKDGKPKFTGSFYDVYDAKATYIDTFFKEGFRISQYTGRDFDLSITVEKDAEDYAGLKTPKLIKTSRAVAAEDGPLPEDATLPDMLFEIKRIAGHRFESAEELMSKFGRRTVMSAAEEPVTPEESICKGSFTKGAESLHDALQPLYEDEVLSGLLEQMEAGLNEESAADAKILQKIDNRMLQLFGRTFSEYTFIASLRGMGPGLADSPDLNDRPGRLNITTEDFINSYSKEDLLNIAEDFDVILPAKRTKKNMAKAVLLQLFTPESIRSRLIQLENGEMELFRLTAACDHGRFPESEDEELQAENLIGELLMVPLKENRMFVTDLIRNTYEESDKEALETERQKSVWMYKCLNIAGAFYGVMNWDVLGQLYSRRFKGISREELIRIFRRTPANYNDFEECGDKLVRAFYLEDDYYKYLEEKLQQDKPFYIPSRKEIEEFYEKGCLFSSSSHQAMYRFLISKLGYSKKDAEYNVAEIYYCINNSARLQTVIDRVMDGHVKDGAFDSKEDAAEFAQLYMNMNNYSHVMANRGYSPNDLSRAMGGAKRKKIGRNDPCPCGSGKKYKNCCGK